MSLTGIFGRAVARDRRRDGRDPPSRRCALAAGYGRGTRDPGGEAAGRHADAEDADRRGLDRRARRRSRPRASRSTPSPPGSSTRAGSQVLPNGDVLVAEALHRAGRPAQRCSTTPCAARCGAPPRSASSPNRITRLRDADGDGVAEVQRDLPRRPEPALRHGAARRHLLRRQHRRRRGLPLRRGRQHRITGPGRTARDLQARRATGPAACLPSPDGTKLYVGRRLAQQHRRARHGGRGGPRRDLRARPRHRHEPHLRQRACATRWASPGSPPPARSGPWSTSATAWATRRRPTT